MGSTSTPVTPAGESSIRGAADPGRPVGPGGPGEAPTLPAGPWVLWAAVALTLVPLVASALALTFGGGAYAPYGDLAGTELLTRDVGRYAVEVGPYSRDGWFHPGPAMFYVLAVPYRLLGSTSTALDVGALLVNGASVVGMALIARRRSGVPLALLTLLGCALAMRAFGPDRVRLPWNPYLPVLPYGLLLYLTWSMACRSRWALPAAVAVASFVAQTHIGYLGLAMPLLVVGAAWLLVGTRRDARRPPPAPDDEGDGHGGRVEEHRSGSLRRPALAALAVAVAMWVLPVVQQLTTEPGNLGRTLRWFQDGGTHAEDPQGVGAAWSVISEQLALRPVWLVGEPAVSAAGEPRYLHDAALPVLGLLLVLAGWWIVRRRAAVVGRLLVVWAVAVVLGIVATARTLGPVYAYRLGWASILGMVAGVVVAWAGWDALARRYAAVAGRVLAPLVLVGLVVLATVGTVAHVREGRPDEDRSARLAEVVPDVIAALPEGDGPVVVTGRSSFLGLALTPTLVLQLERRGVDARTADGDRALGEHRADDGGPLRAYLTVVDAESVATVELPDGAELVAYAGEVPYAEALRLSAEDPAALSDRGMAVYLSERPGKAGDADAPDGDA